jgi:regulatory protein
VELDGRPWRRLPVAVVVDSGLSVGCVLDRERARAIARARRRRRAEELAVRALARRDHSRTSLEERLSRTRVPAAERRAAIDRAVDAGLVDDARFAERRARHLAERGAGDLLVVDDLERHGVSSDDASVALASIEPEAERAARIVRKRGASRKTIRYLARRGFTEATLEGLVADPESWALR